MALEELLKEKTKELEDTRKELRSEKEAFIKMYNQYVQEKEEKERLNNIINELEIDSICGYYKPESEDNDYLEGYDDGARLTAKFFHNKIKELKGEDKE